MKKNKKANSSSVLRNNLIAFLQQNKLESFEDKMIDDLLMNIEKIREHDFDSYELRLLSTAFKELRHSFRIFKEYYKIPKAAVFGSARTPKRHPDYQIAREFGKSLVKRKWMVITGGASGIMEAAMVGAGTKNSFGLNIRLPFEQDANEVIRGNKKLMNFKYFFTRKLMFLKESQATVLFPGGFGTFDEGFESLTLIQTGKARPRPVVLVDSPGSNYWSILLDAFRATLEKEKFISQGDLDLMDHCQNAEQAADIIERFYSNYHSSRFMGDDYLIRLKKPATALMFKRLNRDFADVLSKGTFSRFKKIADDDVKDKSLHRIVFSFNKSSYARLKKLIDHLNEY